MEMLMVFTPGSWERVDASAISGELFVENVKFSRRGMAAQTRLICWTAYPFLLGIPTQNKSV